MFYAKRNASLICAALVVAGGLSALSQAASADPVSPLVGARSIQVTETFSMSFHSGDVGPAELSHVWISGQKVRMTRLHLANSPIKNKGKALSELESDGKTLWEYDGDQNEYYKFPAPPAISIYHQDPLQFSLVAQLDMFQNPAMTLSDGDIKNGVTRTVTQIQNDGKPATVITDTTPVKALDGTPASLNDVLYVTTDTGLPYRRVQELVTTTKTSIIRQIDFADWVINKPIPATQFAWTVPTTAKLHVDVKLLAAGTPAPDFAVVTPAGQTVHLSDYKGKTVVLDFWATWCGPCKQSMPHLESVYQQIKGKDVAVLAVCVWDTKTAYDKWLSDNKTTYSFPTVFDPAADSGIKPIPGLYGILGIPAQYVIDKNGIVVAGYTGYDPKDHRLEAALATQNVNVPVAQADAATPASPAGTASHS